MKTKGTRFHPLLLNHLLDPSRMTMMRTITEDLTVGLSLGRRQTRFGLTGVEAQARLRRQETIFPDGLSFGKLWRSLWKVRTSQTGIVSNTSLKQNAPVSPFRSNVQLSRSA